AAAEQLQLDVYGDVIDAAVQLLVDDGEADREVRSLLRALGEYVRRHWREPDEGIWEPRSGRARHTHSLLLCWTALDRLISLDERGLLRLGPTLDLERARARLRREIEER